METAVAMSSRWSEVSSPRCMRARERFQFASTRAGECPMQRQMFDTVCTRCGSAT